MSCGACCRRYAARLAMIAKGNLHAHGAKLAAYLTTSCAEERAELVELRGFAATTIRDAFIDVQMQATATRATKPFFHAYVRVAGRAGPRLAPELWRGSLSGSKRSLASTASRAPWRFTVHQAASGTCMLPGHGST